jgi:hypothetical protein
VTKNKILLIAIFTAVITSSLYAEDYREFKLQPRQQTVHHASYDRVQLRLNELSRELNLSPEQASKAKTVLLKSQEESAQALKEAKEKVRNSRVKANDEISALLDNQQKAKFSRLRKKHETVPKTEE